MDTVLHKAPTVYEELRLIDSIYKTSEELKELLLEHGYKQYTVIEVPKVDCFMYLPTGFPTTQEEVAEFDFSEYKDKRITVGVCIGGTCLCTGWDEKAKLGVQGILKINHNCSCADRATTQIFLALDDFCKEFSQLSIHNITLDVHICGYSLGGLFAQVTTILLQDWANTSRNTVTCRTYESPGIPEMYHEISRNYDENAREFWQKKITNYKSLPNPLNTVFEDVGKLFHLKNSDHIACDSKWVVKCIAGTTKRALFWTGLLRGFGVSSLTSEFGSMNLWEQKAVMGAAVAAELGMDLCEVVRNHHVGLLLTCFDEKSGAFLPERCREMKQWPIYDDFEEAAMKLMENAARGFIPMHPRNAGLHTLFLFGGKRGYVERKLEDLPGYLPMPATT